MIMSNQEAKECAKFKEGYDKLETFADMDKLVEETPKEIRIKIAQGMQLVNATTGLTMRQEALMRQLLV